MAKVSGPLAGIQSSLIYRLSSRRGRFLSSSPVLRQLYPAGEEPVDFPRLVNGRTDERWRKTGCWQFKSLRHRLSFLALSWFIGRRADTFYHPPGIKFHISREDVAISDKRHDDTITYTRYVMTYYWLLSANFLPTNIGGRSLFEAMTHRFSRRANNRVWMKYIIKLWWNFNKRIILIAWWSYLIGIINQLFLRSRYPVQKRNNWWCNVTGSTMKYSWNNITRNGVKITPSIFLLLKLWYDIRWYRIKSFTY